MLKATYELIVHVDSFKNIDLYQQGLYFLKFFILHNNENATPYNYFQGSSSKKKDNNAFQAPHDDPMAFQTKTFMIRFQDEEIDLDESCIFKIEVNASPSYEYEFILQCELMCADISRIGNQSDESLFKCVNTFEAQIANTFRGVHQYVPIMFDNHHFCVVNSTIHGSLHDFKFRLSDLQVQLNQESRKNVLIQPKTFAEFVHRCTTKFTKVEEFFNYYVGQMRESCESMQQMVGRLFGLLKLFDELQKLPMIPKFSYIQYYESALLAGPPKSKISICDVLDLRNIKDQFVLTSLIENDINQYSAVLFQLQNLLVSMIQKQSKQYRQILQQDYNLKIKDKWGETYLRDVIKSEDFSKGKQSQKEHFAISEQLRSKKIITEPFDVQDISHPEIKQSTILFEEIYRRGQREVRDATIHLLVLCHGFQGNSLDMRLVRNNLSLQHPNIYYLLSKANEDQTDNSISDQGYNLAQEVKQYVQDYIKNNKFKLSFVGHSLGGIIIRAALPHLQQFKLQMYSFISLSSPHLGYVYNSSKLIDAGLWFLKRMRKSISLQQLSMTDSEVIENAFLYQLSKQQGLNWFSNILLVSSAQDQYVPFESARIQSSESSDNDAAKYEKMVQNIMQGLRAQQVHRLDVNFNLDDNRALDNMIGRSAHIMFLDNTPFLRMLATCVDEVFD